MSASYNLPARAARERQQAPWAFAVLGAVLGLFLALLFWAPATWLAWGVAQVSQQRVVLQSVRGSMWKGSAQLLLSGGEGTRGAQALPGRVHWKIQPDGLSAKFSLHADCCMNAPTQWVARADGTTLRLSTADHRSQWPAVLLSGLGAPWNSLQATGQLTLQTEGLAFQWAAGRWLLQGQMELHAQQMASRLSTLKPMGSYRLLLRGTPQGSSTPELQLSTTQGPLQLTGQGQWVGARLRFTGEASADEGSEIALTNLLNIIGRRQGGKSLLSLG
jgi:general secretion pathway protein N